MDLSQRTMQEVWDHHGEAVASQDVDEFLKDFANDCVMITPGRTYRGHGEIAGWFQDFLIPILEDAEFASDGPVFERNLIYLNWDMESKTHTVKDATDTFIVEDGRFAILTVNINAIRK